MSQYWSALVHTLTPYVPGEQPKLPNLVKLNTNENPYPPSPSALAAMQAELGADAARLRLYPDPNCDLLKHAVAEHFAEHGIVPSQVFVGNGSDEVLAHVFMALLKHDKPLLMPDISYSFYPVYCGLYGITLTSVPLDAEFAIRIDDYLALADQCGGVIVANPNAPTGRPLPLREIDRLCAGLPQAVVVVDGRLVVQDGLRRGRPRQLQPRVGHGDVGDLHRLPDRDPAGHHRLARGRRAR